MLATAAAGLNAGVGLHAAVAGAPSSDAGPSASYHRRTRHLGLLLSALTTGAATAAYQRGARRRSATTHPPPRQRPAEPLTAHAALLVQRAAATCGWPRAPSRHSPCPTTSS
jgi:uncharacterized membrane protein YidH (DUF202 family)